MKATWLKFTDSISDAAIQKIITMGDDMGWKQSTVGGVEKINDVDHKLRKGDIVFFHDQQWLYDLVWPYMETANEMAGWNFDIELAEEFHLTRWSEGGHYDYHVDGRGFDVYNTDNNLNGLTRKISMVIWLNDDFEGGEFEFHPTYGAETHDSLHKPVKGSALLFPSWMVHRVKPVIRGTRYSLLTCFVGKPIR